MVRLLPSRNWCVKPIVDGVFDHKAYTEKALARLVKAKAKADRAAQRASAASSGSPSKAPTPPVPDDNAPTPDPTCQPQGTEQGDGIVAKDPVANRTELLRSRPELVGRFTRLLVPVLVDVYAASVASHVRTKTLTGLLKAVSFLDGDDLRNALMVGHGLAFLLMIIDCVRIDCSLYPWQVSQAQSCRRKIIQRWWLTLFSW